MRHFYHPHKGLWYPSMPCGSPGPRPGGEVEGLAGRGSPGPHPGVSRPTPGGVSRPSLGGSCLEANTQGRGVCIPACTEADARSQQTATAASCTIPTGMHSCTNVNVIIRHKKTREYLCRAKKCLVNSNEFTYHCPLHLFKKLNGDYRYKRKL